MALFKIKAARTVNRLFPVYPRQVKSLPLSDKGDRASVDPVCEAVLGECCVVVRADRVLNTCWPVFVAYNC